MRLSNFSLWNTIRCIIYVLVFLFFNFIFFYDFRDGVPNARDRDFLHDTPKIWGYLHMFLWCVSLSRIPMSQKLGETLKSTHLNKSHYHACYKCWMLCACMGILLKIEINLELKDWIWCLSMLMKMLESRTQSDFKLLEPIDILEKVLDQHWICMHKFIGNTYQCCNGYFTLCFSIFFCWGWESLARDQWRKHFL